MAELDISQLTRDFSCEDQAWIKQAFIFASKAHTGQKRYSGEDFITHPYSVAVILKNLELDPQSIVAGLLHDTVEDTEVTESDIAEIFGKRTAFLVSSLTKIRDMERKGKQATSYQTLMKMFFAMTDDIRVILIKLADQLHNLQTLQYMPVEKQKERARKSLDIYAPIAERLNMGELKGAIEDLAFLYGLPKEHEQLMMTAEAYYNERKRYTDEIAPIIKGYLEKHGIEFVLDCRVKHYYSLYKKLLRKNNNINLIYDLVAFRLIVPNIESCYEALGIIHKYYHPLPKHIKDYIALPKPNGYQSLHTTVFCEKGQIVEFQVRTRAMHDHAEKGIAAHWIYKESGSAKSNINVKELVWINKIREWRQYINNPEEFFDLIKMDMFRNRIFVFTPKGDVKDLPEGATPIDFAYAIHTDIGDHCVGAKVNEKMESLKHRLENGDVCKIITSKKQKPTQGWLEHVQTSEARRRIKNFIYLEENKNKK